MKKILSFLFLCALAMTASAVPARRGWQTRTQADGTTIEIQQLGDEFYHYMINREGKQVREVNGMYVEVGEAPTPVQAKARRAKIAARRQRKAVGTEPNLAPKGVVILANFKDKSMQSSHTQAVFNELCNSANCTVNDGYPSAAQYFADQSNGAYRPVFDVFGPVTLSRNLDYYGHNLDENGYPTDESNDNTSDQYATDAVVEACILANQNYSINWADYDSDSDGKIDFVYVIYAGQGEADGGAANTIWPHNWEVSSARYYGSCTYTASQCKVGGKTIENYAMSGEMSGNSLGGIGTLCHEFGHVMGLPDWYDTEYGYNYEHCLTPNDWDIMDGGAYNGDGHCPPNYSPWEKYFFGWHTPLNLGNTGANLTLYPNGTENYQAYQINASGTQQTPTTSGWCYFIENRQNVGWDEPLTGHGMLIWKVNFDASAWTNNTPNNTNNAPLYTIVSATGTAIGWDGSTDNCPKNTFPGSGHKTSYNGISGKPLLNIAESGQKVTLTYIEEPSIVVEPFDITWKANGADFSTTSSTGTIVLPTNEPKACEGMVFVGWTAAENYSSATTAPTLVNAGDAITEPATFYAVFATQSGEATVEISDELTLSSTGVSGTNYASWSGVTATSDAVYAGQSAGGNDAIQLRSKNSNSGIVTTASGGKLTKVQVVWNSNTSGRTLDIYGKNSAYTDPSDLYDASRRGTKLGSIASGTATELAITGDYTFVGVRSNNGALYMDKITFVWEGSGVGYSNYTTSCNGGQTAIEHTEVEQPATVKAIRNGQMVILVGNEVYSLTGSRLE